MVVQNVSQDSTPIRVEASLPAAVNWHFWPWCNYGCTFCFAQFDDLPKIDRLPKEIALRVPKQLAMAGAKKITFVGGEPTMCPYLPELLKASKDVGLTTCIVSNGTGLDETFLAENHELVDWIGLSIDASNDEIHAKIGRGMRKDLRDSRSQHLVQAMEVWKRCQSYGIKMKLNTVVCTHNVSDDMTDLVLELRPTRWKIFQVLRVDGQNDDMFDELEISTVAFDDWLARHEHVQDYGVQFVPESNDLMRGSYAMLDALGRFYSNTDGSHNYGPALTEVGVLRAWNSVQFLEDRFIERGGEYEW
jgi:radical S-adenosyl methionine domain-containing protein 2